MPATLVRMLIGLAAAALIAASAVAGAPEVHYRTLHVDGVDIFYREAGPPGAPTVLLLHGFPTSSHMFRDLIPRLAATYHVIAPDYPGYGYSGAPSPKAFAYTFDHLADVIDRFTRAVGVERFALYMQDFGGPVGLRLAVRSPERVTALVIQNANAYEEGLSPAMDVARPAWAGRTPQTEAALRAFLTPESTRFQYLHGARDPSRISPDAWTHAQALLDRPGNAEIQLELLHDYGSNVERYPAWQAYLRRHRPPALIVWGRNDPFFTLAGARAYARDLPDSETHILDAGHFALEEEGATIARLVVDFLDRRLARPPGE